MLLATGYHAPYHYDDVKMGAMASQITSLMIVYSTVYSDADQRKHQSSASLAFVRGIHRGPVNSPHKWLVTRKMFPFDDVIMSLNHLIVCFHLGCVCFVRYFVPICLCDMRLPGGQLVVHLRSNWSADMYVYQRHPWRNSKYTDIVKMF